MGPKHGRRHGDNDDDDQVTTQPIRSGKNRHDVVSDDMDDAEEHAARHAGDSADRSMFTSAVGMLKSNKDKILSGDVDESAAVNAHKAFYGSGGSSSADSSSMGSAAAMQAFKMFSGSGSSESSSSGSGMLGSAMGMMGGSSGGSSSSGGAGMISSLMGMSSGSSSSSGQNAFVGMAMAEASKLYDSQNASGNVSSGTDKQSVINEAAQQAMLYYAKSQLEGGSTSSGSASGLMSMAGKFMGSS